MGVHPKIGITGLPRSGKSAVMEKVLDMLLDERKREISMRGGASDKPILGGLRTEPLLENGERMGYKVIDIVSGEEGIIAHKGIDSRLRVLGYGIDIEELNRVALPAIDHAQHHCEVLVIDEIGKFSVESEAFVQAVRSALEVDMPTLLTLHKKSRHPLLQDIRRRDDGRILEGHTGQSSTASVQDSQVDARNLLKRITRHRFLHGAIRRGRHMHPPNVAVERLLYGTGVGLLLGAGFGLQNGRVFGASPPALEGFLLAGALCFLLGWMLGNGNGPLARWFSHETEEAMASRVRADIEEVHRSEDVTAKWAAMEAKVLSQDLGEEA